MLREPDAKPVTLTEHMMMEHGDPPDLSTDHDNAVLAAIERLPEEQRRVIEAKFFQLASYRQIGRMLNVNHVNAWRQVKRALADLQTELANDPTIQRRYHL